MPLSSAAEVVFVRDTGYSLEKGVSLHECTGKRCFPFATQEISRKKVCRCMNVPENGVSPFAIQVILRKMVCRGECEVKKGRERKGSGSGGMVGR